MVFALLHLPEKKKNEKKQGGVEGASEAEEKKKNRKQITRMLRVLIRFIFSSS